MPPRTAASGLSSAEAAAAYQPLDSDLTAIAALSTTSYGRALLTLADAAALRTAADIGNVGRAGILPASGVSAGSTYEVTTATEPGGPGLLQLKRVRNFPTSRTIAAASPEYSWLWQNRTGWSPASADDNTTNAGESTWAFGTTSVVWFSSYTAPFRYRVVYVGAGDVLEVICRVKSNANQIYELGGILVALDSDTTKWTRAVVGYDNGISGNTGVNTADTANQKGNTSYTSGEVAAGIWIKMRWTSEGFRVWSSASTSTTPPTAWTASGGGALTGATPWGNTAAALRVGMMAQNENITAGFVIKFCYFSISINGSLSTVQSEQWGTELFSTSAVEQLIGEIDFGVAVTLDQTALRNLLTDATNTRPGDTATVTYSVVSGSSTGPASGTYYAANAVVVPAAGRFVRVYYKVLSATGVEQGSVRLPRALPIAS